VGEALDVSGMDQADRLTEFRAGGRALFSLGLVKGSEGNLSTFDGRTLAITRTGSSLAVLEPTDVVEAGLDGTPDGASSDLEVHRRIYRSRGPGAVAHAHPPGTVPEDGGGPGAHGAYEFAPTLEAAVAAIVRKARSAAPAIRPIEWRGRSIRILDQTQLPVREAYLDASTPLDVADAIRRLAIRGAPLLGVAAAYGVALAAATSSADTPARLLADLEAAAGVLEASRPTAVNLGWAARRTLAAARAGATGAEGAAGVDAGRAAALAEAEAIRREDEDACRTIGEHGLDLIPSPAGILTHCNTGALATAGWGTALGVVVAAHRAGRDLHVWVDETRPLLQGARLTTWELRRLGIPMTLVADAAAGSLMGRGLVDVVIVGADRITARGDVANKIGTYSLAVLARHHGIPFVVAAPTSTIDLAIASGAEVPIEERGADEVVVLPGGTAVAPAGVPVWNPAFDVTPASLVTAIVTERGIARPPFEGSLADAVRAANPRDGMAAAGAPAVGAPSEKPA
jgi:methylthioribose-1-phosphate isomerase